MPSVNKASLHEEFETLKARFEHLCAEGKMGKDDTTPQPGAKSKGPEHDKTRSNNTRTVETVEPS